MPTGFALTIGVNQVIPENYFGFFEKLHGCENDAASFADLLLARNFTDVSVLRTDQATVRNVVDAIERLARNSVAGDLAVIFYSGHGAQFPNLNVKEIGSIDESWCLYDGPLLDDDLNLLVRQFKPDVRLLVVSDSCFSGTMLDVMFKLFAMRRATVETLTRLSTELSPRIFGLKGLPENTIAAFVSSAAFPPASIVNALASGPKIVATTMLMCACTDRERTADGDPHSAYTQSLLDCWGNGSFSDTYQEFSDKIAGKLPAQIPDLKKLNPIPAGFAGELAFVI